MGPLSQHFGGVSFKFKVHVEQPAVLEQAAQHADASVVPGMAAITGCSPAVDVSLSQREGAQFEFAPDVTTMGQVPKVKVTMASMVVSG